MRIVSRIWAWLGGFDRRSVSQISAVDTRRREAVNDQRQREIDFLKKVVATVSKVD